LLIGFLFSQREGQSAKEEVGRGFIYMAKSDFFSWKEGFL